MQQNIWLGMFSIAKWATTWGLWVLQCWRRAKTCEIHFIETIFFFSRIKKQREEDLNLYKFPILPGWWFRLAITTYCSFSWLKSYLKKDTICFKVEIPKVFRVFVALILGSPSELCSGSIGQLPAPPRPLGWIGWALRFNQIFWPLLLVLSMPDAPKFVIARQIIVLSNINNNISNILFHLNLFKLAVKYIWNIRGLHKYIINNCDKNKHICI